MVVKASSVSASDHFTFGDIVALSVRLGFDDVTLYQALHDLLQPVNEKQYS